MTDQAEAPSAPTNRHTVHAKGREKLMAREGAAQEKPAAPLDCVDGKSVALGGLLDLGAGKGGEGHRSGRRPSTGGAPGTRSLQCFVPPVLG